MNALFLIYPVLIMVLMFRGADLSGFRKRTVEGGDPFAAHNDFFTQSKLLKAAACLFIMLHHLVQRTSSYGWIDKGPINIFNDFGYLFTAVFFFFSGFGLIFSVISNDRYLDTFLIKRLPTVLIPFWLVNLLNILVNRFVYNRKEGVIEILKDFFGILLIDGNGWFIIEIVVIYLMFYIIFRLIKNQDLALLILSIAVLLIIPYALSRGHDTDGMLKNTWFRGEWWFISTVTFIFGMLYGRFQEEMDAFFKKHYKWLLPLSAVLWVALHFASVSCLRFLGYYKGNAPGALRSAVITLIVQNIDSVFFMLTILLFSMKIKHGNPALKFISGMSLELFLIHGCIVKLVFDKVDTENDVLRFAIVYAAAIAVTALLAPAMKFLVKRVIEFLRFITADERNRKKVALGILAFLLAAAAIVGGFLYGERIFFAKETYEDEMKLLRNAGMGTHVQFGRYDTNPLIPGGERMTWIVIAKKDGIATLLADEGIDGSYYHQHHEEVTWETCDLRTHINSGDYLKMFNKYEHERIEAVDGDIFTLLTVEEAESFFKEDKERELTITAVAKNRGTNVNQLSKVHRWDMKNYRTSWWWLRGSDNEASLTAPIVTEDGTIETGKKYVNKPSGAIRPVIHVRYGI